MRRLSVIVVIFFFFVFPFTSGADQIDDTLNRVDNLIKEMSNIKNEEPNVSLRALNTPLLQVLQAIEKASGEAMVIDEGIDISKEVSVDFKDIPITVALNKVLTPLGISSKYDGEKFFIFIYEERSWTLPLPPVRTSFTINVSNEGQSSGPTPTYGGYGGAGGQSQTGPGGAGILHKAEYNPENFWKTLEDNIKRMISDKGTYAIDPTSGVVHVRDYSRKIAEIDSYIKGIASQSRKKAVVEVKVVEVSLKKGYQFGVDWDLIKRKALSFTDIASTSTIATKNLTSPLSFKIDTRMWGESYSGLLKMLEEFGDVNVISQPTLLMGNNEAAVITAGDMTTYIANVTKTVTGVSASESYTVTPGVVQEGVILSILTRILDNNRIFINVTPVISDIKQIRQIQFGDTYIEAPDTVLRSMNTASELNDGETLVIGGLVVNKTQKDKAGIPFLSRIPILGGLFGYETGERFKKDIAIFITPRIVKETL